MPFLKVDKGLEAEADGVSLMKPIPGLDTLLERAVKLGVFGTKMRSTINLPSESGIAAIARAAVRDRRADLAARADPDPRARSLDQEPRQGRGRGDLLRDALTRASTARRRQPVMLKLTIPDSPRPLRTLIAT